MATAILCAVVYAAPQKGTMTDSRDGQTYRTVKIGSQTWMAENLNVKTEGSLCYANKSTNCKKYGRLYKWEAAMNACPTGWRLPSFDDFETLVEVVGGAEQVGRVLKSKAGWKNRGNGIDALGFAAMPAGFRKSDGKYGGEGSNAFFWSSTDECGDNMSCIMGLSYDDEGAYLDGHNMDFWKSVRCIKNEVIDSRDGQTYRTVQIGGDEWIAENLNIIIEDSWCYADEESNCEKFGRLYSWNAALKACPSGWHLPSISEFKTLFEVVGGESVAGKKLKSNGDWNNTGDGTDAFAFSALPAGYRYDDGIYADKGDCADFWSSTENNDDDAFYMDLGYNDDYVRLDSVVKYDGFSVRCVKDNGKNITDSRDGKTYTTEIIGDQKWMTENLNVKIEGSWCYNGEESNCKKYGRLYTWEAAMKACPSGWHLPSRSEFETLFEAVDGKSKAGKMLKSKTGWSGSGNGFDAYAFSALPAGNRYYNGDFIYEGYNAYFWSSTEDNSSDAYYMYLFDDDDGALLNFNSKYYGFSVRCVKD